MQMIFQYVSNVLTFVLKSVCQHLVNLLTNVDTLSQHHHFVYLIDRPQLSGTICFAISDL